MSKKTFNISLTVLLLTLVAVIGISARKAPAVVRTNLENIPMVIDTYHGEADSFSAEVYAVLSADKHVYRHYRHADGENIDLYIGYYGTAKGGRTGHNPYACLPSSGWAIVDQGRIEVTPENRQDSVQLNYVLARKEDINNIMIHWYQASGSKVLASGVEQNIQRFIGRVLHNRNDGAYVQVSSLSDDSSIAEERERLVEFARRMLMILPDYWPIEE